MDKLDAKIVTSVGGIVVALACIYLWAADNSEIHAAIRYQADLYNTTQQNTNQVLRDLTKVIETNNQLIQSFNKR